MSDRTARTAAICSGRALGHSALSAAAAAARSRNLQGWAILNTRSSVDPFLTFGDDRALREQVWKKFVNRGDNGDANDTNATIAEIVKLRDQRAKLLGFRNHAEWRMQDTMAKTPAAANDLMMRVWAPAKARVAEEVADMRAIAGHDIEPWDYLYFAEKVRKQKYDLDQNQLKPYFELHNVRAGSFYMAERLYGFTFERLAPGTVPVRSATTRSTPWPRSAAASWSRRPTCRRGRRCRTSPTPTTSTPACMRATCAATPSSAACVATKA